MRKRPYLVVAVALLGVYVLAAIALLATKDFDDRGPLSLHQPALTEPLDGALAPSDVARRCFGDAKTVKVVGGLVQGRPYHACYRFDDDELVLDAKVVDGQGFAVNDTGLVKESGAWPWIATVDNGTDLVFGAVGLGVILGMGWTYGRRGRPPEQSGPWWSQSWLLVVLALIPLLGWVVLALLPRVDAGARPGPPCRRSSPSPASSSSPS